MKTEIKRQIRQKEMLINTFRKEADEAEKKSVNAQKKRDFSTASKYAKISHEYEGYIYNIQKAIEHLKKCL